MIEGLFTILVIAVLSIILHELGHLIMFKYYGVKTKFVFERLNPVLDGRVNTTKKKIIIYLGGIIFGLVPLIFYFLLVPFNIITYFVLIGMYVIGCGYDYQQIMILIKKNRDN
jgi:membrane-associated protease RseP (regulator of RpoE activity)